MSTVRTRAHPVLRRREAGAELGRGLADRRRPVAARPGLVGLVELVEGPQPDFSILTFGTSTTAIAHLPPNGRLVARLAGAEYRLCGRVGSKPNSSAGPLRPIGHDALLRRTPSRCAAVVAARSRPRRPSSLAAVAMAPGAGAGSNPRLLPDLVTMRVEPGRPGLEPSEGSSSCGSRTRSATGAAGRSRSTRARARTTATGTANPANDRDVYQRIFLDSNGDGVFERAQDTDVRATILFGCERYHPAHHHWHVLDFARYKLVREQSGQHGRSLDQDRLLHRSTPTTRSASLPGSPARRLLPGGQRGLRPGLDRRASPSAGPTPTATACPGSS